MDNRNAVRHREQTDVWVERSHLVLLLIVSVSGGIYMYQCNQELIKDLKDVHKQASDFKARVHTGFDCYQQMTSFVNVLESLVRKQANAKIMEHVYSGLGSLMGFGQDKKEKTGKEAFNYARCQNHMSQIMAELRKEAGQIIDDKRSTEATLHGAATGDRDGDHGK